MGNYLLLKHCDARKSPGNSYLVRIVGIDECGIFKHLKSVPCLGPQFCWGCFSWFCVIFPYGLKRYLKNKLFKSLLLTKRPHFGNSYWLNIRKRVWFNIRQYKIRFFPKMVYVNIWFQLHVKTGFAVRIYQPNISNKPP